MHGNWTPKRHFWACVFYACVHEPGPTRTYVCEDNWYEWCLNAALMTHQCVYTSDLRDFFSVGLATFSRQGKKYGRSITEMVFEDSAKLRKMKGYAMENHKRSFRPFD